MELKAWEYEEFPEFNEAVEGATWLDTTGDEQGVQYVMPQVLGIVDEFLQKHLG